MNGGMVIMLSRVAQSVWLRTGRPGDRDSIPGFFPVVSCFPTGYRAHPASYTVGTAGSFPGDKAVTGRDANRSLPYSAETKNI
jgi:hypothetical protein